MVTQRTILIPLLFQLLVGSWAAASDIWFGQSASFSGGAWEPGGRFKAGIEAAFAEVNAAGGVNNRTLRLVSVDDQYDVAKIPANVAKLLAENNLIAFAGFTGSSTVVAAVPYATAAKMPMIGPLTGTASIRKTFNPYVINVRAGYDDEAMAMLKLLVEVKRLKRISICYQNDSFGAPSKDAIVSALRQLKLSLVGIHSFEKSAMASLDYAAFVGVVMSRQPQAVILFGVEGFSNPFLQTFYQLHRGSDVTFVTGSWIGDANRNFLREKGLDPTHFYQTQIVPHPLSRASNMSIRYRAAMQSFEGATNAVFDYVSLEGYVLGRFLIDALWRTKTLTKEGLLDAIYSTRMFTLDELLAGPFSNTCDSSATSLSGRSSLCNCNQGLRFVSTTGLTASYEFTVAASDLVYPITECFSPNNVVTRPVLLATFVPSNSSAAIAGMSSVTQAIAAGSANTMFFESMLFAESGPLNATTQRLYEVGNRSLLMGALGGMVLPEQAVYPVIEVFTQPALPAKSFLRNTIHVLATLQQEMLVNAKHLAHVHNGTSINLLLSENYTTEECAALEELVEHSLQTFQRSLDGVHTFGPRSALHDVLASIGTTAAIILGLTSSDVPVLVAHFTINEQVTAYLPFGDVALLWDVLQKHDNCETLPQRVFFSTSLPNWMDASSSTFVANYHNAVSSSEREKPLSAIGYLVARFIDFNLERTGGDSDPAAFVEGLYRSSVVTLDELSMGPFVDVQCTDTDCLCNVGPRVVSTFSISSFIEVKAADVDVHFSSCAVSYVLPASKGANTLLIALLSILIPLFVFILLAVAGYIAKRKLKVAHAPKDASKKFCTMFVTLKKESVLWELYPYAMADITSRSSTIIRNAVGATQCYEVKHVGAAVMAVAREPDSLLECAAAITAQLAKVDWKKVITDARVKSKYVPSEGVSTPLKDNMSLSKSDIATSGAGSAARAPKSNGPLSNDRHSHGKSMESSHMSSRSNLSKLDETAVSFAIGIHRDAGRIQYNDSENTYDYSGPSVDGAAAVSDAAVADQILVSQAAGTGAFEEKCFIEFTTVTFKKHEMKLLQFNPPGQAVRTFEQQQHDDGANVDSIAAALEQQSSGVTSKKIVVVDAFLPSLLHDARERSREEFAAVYGNKLKRIQDMVRREKGFLQSFTGGRLTVTFNAAAPTPQAVKRAYIVANELLDEDFELGEVTCGIACGKSLVGAFKSGAEQHNAVVGDIPETALRLEMMCRSLSEVSILTTDSAYDELQLFALSQFVDIVRMPGSSKASGILAIMGFKPTGENDEWMYELEGGMKLDPYLGVNAVYEKLLKGADPRSDEISELAKTLSDSFETGSEKPLGLKQLGCLLTACNTATGDVWSQNASKYLLLRACGGMDDA